MQIGEEPSQAEEKKGRERERRMKEEAATDPGKRWQGRDGREAGGGREPGRCSGCIPLAGGKDEAAETQ